MHIEVSIGEALDKLSILDIKCLRITDAAKLEAIRAEQAVLSEVRVIAESQPLLYALLVETNKSIWDLTDTVKALIEMDSHYATIAQQIFNENQKRFRIKRLLNTVTSSSLHEQKSYSESEICMTVTNPRIASSALWALALQYDTVFISGENTTILEPMFRQPTFRYDIRARSIVDTEAPIDAIERLTPPPIRYAAGGRLGDFIHQLSVIYEKYLQTGRRGILYVGETDVGGDHFARGRMATIRDISPILMSLPYIHSIEPYVGQAYDVNLSQWRSTPDLYSKSWQKIYGDTYGVSWGAHAWLTAMQRSELSDTVLISTSPARWVHAIHWPTYVKTLPGRVLFLQNSVDDYNHFCERSGIEIPAFPVSTFTELVSAIQGCKLFVGTLSMPLAVADALHKNRIALTQEGSPDETIAILTNPNYVNRS